MSYNDNNFPETPGSYLKYMQGVFDAHCHLEQNVSEGQQIADKCRSAGMKGLVTVCARSPDLANAVQISKQNPGFVYYTAGLHPLEATKLTQIEITDYIEQIKKLPNSISSNHPVAIGEIGLDYVLVKEKEKVLRSRQVFRDFVSLANTLKLPISIHCREAYRDTIDILKSNTKQNVVFHYFNQPEYVKEIIDNGWAVSLPLTLAKSKIKAVFEFADLGHVMLETDSPVELGSRRVTPMNIGELVETISKVAMVSEKEIIEKTTKTVTGFFRI